MAIQSCEGAGIANKSVFVSAVTCLTNQTTLAVCACVGEQKRDAGICSAAMSLSLEQLCVCGPLLCTVSTFPWHAQHTHTHELAPNSCVLANKTHLRLSL